eukprot:TRINITY_DN9737_c0_g1_i2.p1 TRINITY_DN9737_c0_g1~~TRINITY_DN9737_c0_g1_i2.p1  ORF type:complete len:141 (+),score=45.62 TRINITY_DN9737_c0_g1_i2:76-498(+)
MLEMMDDEPSLPRATVVRLMKQYAGDDVRFSPATIDLIVDCCVEFIHILTSASNEICASEKKVQIKPDHLIKALESLGFSNYVEDVRKVYDSQESEVKAKKQKLKPTDSGLSEEELRKNQQDLFNRAKENMEAKIKEEKQ